MVIDASLIYALHVSIVKNIKIKNKNHSYHEPNERSLLEHVSVNAHSNCIQGKLVLIVTYETMASLFHMQNLLVELLTRISHETLLSSLDLLCSLEAVTIFHEIWQLVSKSMEANLEGPRTYFGETTWQ